MAATNKTFWGQCQEEIEWARMRKTSGCHKRHERIKIAKLMHIKRGTLDYLQKFDISDTICIMCKQNKEANRYALCLCTHPTIVKQRHNAAVAIRLSTRKYGGTPAMENIMYTLYKPGKTGTANNMRIEELRERSKTKIHCPKEWTKSYKREPKIPTEHT
jgi:hypothetical protein